MKKQTEIILFELLIIFLLIINLFFPYLKSDYAGALFLGILLTLSILYKGFEKDKSENTIDILLSILSYVLCYFMFLYLLGIFSGYAKTIYNTSFIGIVKNIFPVILTIFVEELFRYEIVSKTKKSKQERTIIFLLAFLLILFDIRNSFPLGDNLNAILDGISLRILPNIARNLLFTYMMYLVGYKPVIFYRLLMELPIYIVPVYPNFGNYLTGVLDITFPFIVCLLVRSLATKKREFFVREKKHYFGKIVGLFIFFVLAVSVCLTSGYFKYYALGLVSNSMLPEISRGDVVIIKKLDEEQKKEINVGEILVYKADNKVIVHRVVEKNQNGNTYTYRTKGDNNDSVDNIIIYAENIIGVAKYKIPKIGYPSVWLSEWGK